jgi:hypothetical protein
MYIMLRGFIMGGQNSLNLTSLSLVYRLVNILYIFTVFLLLNTFQHEWSRIVMPCNELLYIIFFTLYTVYITLFDAR